MNRHLKISRSLFALLGLALLILPLPAGAAVTETMASSTYLVTVQPGESLGAAIYRTTPIREDNQPYAGHTQTVIQWHSEWQRQADGLCWVSNVNVTLAITTSLPQLFSGTPEQKDEFAAYLQRLKTHENGHADIGRDTARLIEKAIAAAHAPCPAINVFIDTTARGILSGMQARNQAYDLQTQHGKTQGASLDNLP